MCKDANKCFHGNFQNSTTLEGELGAFLQLQALDISLLTCLSLAANPGMTSLQFMIGLKAVSMAQLLPLAGCGSGLCCGPGPSVTPKRASWAGPPFCGSSADA